MPIKMSKNDAIRWLIDNLDPVLKAGGCHLYKSNLKGYSEYGCSLCQDKLETLAEVKKILGVVLEDIMKWDTTARITE